MFGGSSASSIQKTGGIGAVQGTQYKPQSTIPVGTFQPAKTARVIQPAAGNGGQLALGATSTANPYAGYEGTYSGGSAGGSSSGGSYAAPAAPAYDPADMAYLDDQLGRLNNQYNSTNNTLNNGLVQLGDDYNKQVSGANSNQSRAMEDFNTKELDTTRAKDSALTRTDSNARNLADSLRRRIGMAGGANSSAYLETAPGAVAREATKNRTGIVENFGQNFRDLNTTRSRVKTDFESLLSDLESQRKSKESDFRAGILSKQSEIDGSRAEVARQKSLLQGGGYTQARAAMAPYSSAIDSRTAELDGLYNRFRTPFAVKAVDVKAPDLRDYTVDRQTIGAQAQQGTQDPTAYYRPRQDEEEQLV